jgi:hypothetical protein
MAPLPPNSTARLWVDYETCGENHSAQIRLADGEDPAEAATEFGDLITAVTSMFFLSTFLGARYAASGSNVSNDVDLVWPVTWGSAVGPHFASSRYVDFIGRSLDGRRVRFALFGCNIEAEGGDYRIPAAASTAVANGLEVLDNTEGTFVSINGFKPNWKRYVNIGSNAYWRNHIR